MLSEINKMPKRSDGGGWFVLFGGILVVLLVVLVLRMGTGTQVIVQDSPIKFSSVRKHPFDVYADPYHPPERENPYLFGKDRSYQQVGILNGQKGLLPLFGRPSPYSNSKWEYYTMASGLKLPVSYEGKPCNSDTGCDELIGGNKDTVNVLGLGGFRSFVYDSKQPRYDPDRF